MVKTDNMDKMKILVISQQEFFREGVWHSLSRNEDMEVSTIADIDYHALTGLGENPPDVSIIDVDGFSDDYLQKARRFKQRHPAIRIIILSSNNHDTNIFQALKMQADAYLKKDSTPQELVNAIQSVVRGESPIYETFSTRHNVAMRVLHEFQALSRRAENESYVSPLTDRETEILGYIAEGLLNKQIATTLGISEQTIKNHVTSILRKLNANARTEAVVVAIRQGLIAIG